jgi:ankyrin repeat protein
MAHKISYLKISKCIRLNIEKYNDKNYHTQQLHQCAKISDLEGCKKYIKFGADINKLNCDQELSDNWENAQHSDWIYCNTPLHIAVLNEHIDCVKLLLEAGADPNLVDTVYGAPICHASSEELLKLLISHGANINDSYWQALETPLCSAIHQNDIERSKLLIKCGADVNAPSFYGETPLEAACSRHHIEIIRLLLEHGVNTDSESFKNFIKNNNFHI